MQDNASAPPGTTTSTPRSWTFSSWREVGRLAAALASATTVLVIAYAWFADIPEAIRS